MQRELAEQVAALLEQADRNLHEAHCALHDAPGDDASREAERRIATIMALLFQGVTKRLYTEHPSICPPDYRWVLEPPHAAADHWPWTQ